PSFPTRRSSDLARAFDRISRGRPLVDSRPDGASARDDLDCRCIERHADARRRRAAARCDCGRDTGSAVRISARLGGAVFRADPVFGDGLAVRRATPGAGSCNFRPTCGSTVFRVDVRERRGYVGDVVLSRAAHGSEYDLALLAFDLACPRWDRAHCPQEVLMRSANRRARRLLVPLVSVLLGFAGPACSVDAQGMKLVHSQRSLYRDVLVYETRNVRCMCFTRECRVGRQSCMDLEKPDRIVMNYPQMMLAALYAKPGPSSVLIVGLGGGTIPRALKQIVPNVRIDVVEIDPAVVDVAKRHFGFVEAAHVRTIEADGRVFVKRALREGRRYDLVMLDAFDHEYIPEHLLTREFLAEVKGLLA